MDIGSLFASEIQYEEELVMGLKLKLKPRDSGQLDTEMHLTLWPSAEKLCSLIPTLIPPTSSILELGAGTGLVGLFTAKTFPGSTVLITDGNTESVDLIQENIEANSLNARSSHFLWGESAGSFDVILGSDVIYDKDFIHPLLRTISLSLNSHGFSILANHTIRFNPLQRLFFEVAARVGLEVETIESNPIYIVRLTLKSN
ncbi:unnamed protein product [Blepharisma stoltei]|uniref:Methyltransferase domain-containing protein n=1 Tax=Blepharisma stoltei TaxID=1481888 RepID=A0AAU9JSX0_9CILI|nr:unnamed protein product [Blepharisma stoltei]